MNINQLKLEVHGSCKEDEKIKTGFEPNNNESVINKAYLDEKLIEINGHLSKLEKGYNEFELQNNKHSVKAILIHRAVKTAIQILHDKGLFESFPNADKVLKDFLFVTRRRPDLEKLNDDVV